MFSSDQHPIRRIVYMPLRTHDGRTTTRRRSTAEASEGTNRGSEHAYGRAIDLNPLLNPYIDSDGVSGGG
jgi:D-alanyl-D-alanine carboxypeptidase